MLYYPVGSGEGVGRRGRIRCMVWCMIRDSTRNGRIIRVFLLGIKKAGQSKGDIGWVFVGKWNDLGFKWFVEWRGKQW